MPSAGFLFQIPDADGLVQDLFGPMLVRLAYADGAEAVAAAVFMDDILVIDMEGNAVKAGHFLGQNLRSVALDLAQVALGVDDLVKVDAVAGKEGAQVALGPEGGGVDPDLEALVLERVNQIDGALAQALLKNQVEGRVRGRLGLKSVGREIRSKGACGGGSVSNLSGETNRTSSRSKDTLISAPDS